MKKCAPQFYYIKHFMDSPPIGQFNVFSLFEFMYLYIYPTYIEAPLGDRYHFKRKNHPAERDQLTHRPLMKNNTLVYKINV